MVVETYRKDFDLDDATETATRRRFKQTINGKEGVDRTSASLRGGLTRYPVDIALSVL